MRTMTPTTDQDSRESTEMLETPAVPEIREILETAHEVLERERQELTAERRAFERFQRHVAALETTTPQTTIAGNRASAGTGVGIGASAGVGVNPGTSRPTSPGRPSNGLSEIRDAYIETVMSVPHYDDLYDETWLESIAEEFTEELAAALKQHTQLHPQLQQSLVAAAEQAVDSRTQLLELIETECEAIADADRELATVREDLQSLLDQPLTQLMFNALRLTRTRLETLRKRCDDLATKRQAKLRCRRREFVIADIGTIERYFYGGFEHTYPILAAIADLGAGIERGVAIVDRSLERLLVREADSVHLTGRSEP